MSEEQRQCHVAWARSGYIGVVLGLLLITSPVGAASAGKPKTFVRQYLANLKIPVGAGEEIRAAAEDLLASSGVDCNSEWGSEEAWKASVKGRHVLLKYQQPTPLVGTSGEEIRATEVLVPLPRTGWEFLLVRTDQGILCRTASDPQKLAALVCHESVRIHRWEAYAPYCDKSDPSLLSGDIEVARETLSIESTSIERTDCLSAEFSAREIHMINEGGHRLVSVVRGTIFLDPDGPVPGVDMLFELVSPEKGLRFEVVPDEVGVFQLDNVPDGLYCYRTDAYGWQAEEGILEVDSSATSSPLKIQLDFGA